MKSSNPVNILALAVLVLSISRGLIALLVGGIPTQLLYYGVTTFGIAVSLLGTTRKKTQIVGGRNLHRILMINLWLYTFWIGIEMLLGGEMEQILCFSQMALIPFIIYLFLDVDEKVLLRIIFVLSVIVAGSCVLDFILLNTDIVANGKDLYLGYASVIRQDGIPLWQRVGFIDRATGITGSMHDTGNLMAMLSVFWFGIIMTRKGFRYVIVLMPIFIVALLMTMSVSNIFAGCAGLMAIIVYQAGISRLRNVSVIISVFIVGCIMYLLIDHFFSFDWSLMTMLAVKLQSYEEWEAMQAMGGSDWIADIFMLFCGHNDTIKISNISFITECGFVKMAYSSGLFLLIISLLLMLYPVLCFLKSSRYARSMMLPATAAVAVGVLSLWHYGSVLRSTNIFLFYALFAMAIQNLIRNDPSVSKNFIKQSGKDLVQNSSSNLCC